MATTEDRAPLPEIPEKMGMHLGKPAYTNFSDEMRKLIRQSIMPADSSDADLYYLLEMAATYKLDPFAREIWAVKMPGKNGAKANIAILIGRDGMLSIAERNPDYRGFRCQSIHEDDEFSYDDKPRKMPDGTYSHVRHKHGKMGQRGPLLGAWAEVYRHNRPPVYFEAPIEEYARSGEYSPWNKQTSVMIQKCALATALRLAYRVSGLYLADEMTNAVFTDATTSTTATPAGPTLDFGDDPEVAAWLTDLFAALAAADPDNYLPGKQRLLVANRADDLEALATELQVQVLEKTGEVIPKPSIIDADVVSEDE